MQSSKPAHNLRRLGSLRSNPPFPLVAAALEWFPNRAMTPSARWQAERPILLVDGFAANAIMKQANGAGEHLLALEIAETLMEQGIFPDKIPVFQQMARALAILGSSDEARRILEEIPSGRADEAETLGLLARVFKDLAIAAEDAEEKQARYTDSLRCYSEGFERAIVRNDSDGAAYCGINAAATAVWLGETDRAQDFAAKAFSHAEKDTSYYGIATRAETALILGRETEARALYIEASQKSIVEKRWADLASTRKQCRALCQKLHGRRDHLDDCFLAGAVAILSGQPGVEDFPQSGIDRVRAWLMENNIRHAFLCTVPGWDTRLAEITRELKIETHLIGDLGGKAFTHRVIAARGTLLASHLGVSLKALTIGDKPAETAAACWLAASIRPYAIHPSDAALDGIPAEDVSPDPIPFPRAMGVGREREQVLALLHLHFPDYSSMDSAGHDDFQKNILAPLAERIASAPQAPHSVHGYGGDYLFVFGRLHSAALVAMDFMETLEKSFPASLPSMCLHAGPVTMEVNSLLHIYGPSGENVCRTEVIAAALKPGAICATEIFTALSALELLRGFRFEHAGNITLAGRTDRLFRLQPITRP